MRNRAVLFFNYFFPLIFFFVFGDVRCAEQGSAILQVVTMVIAIGILGNGFSAQACAPCRSARKISCAATK